MKKILLLSANPKNTDKLRLDEEVREIQTALRQAKNRAQFEILTELALRVDDLHRVLLEHEPAIVHFSGHGAGNHGLALENNSGQMQLVSTESLARLFGLFQDKIECVLLNACYSETQALAIHQHIDYVIGMNQTIGDKAAIKFAIGFYNALGASRPYEDCFEFGCTSVDLQGIPESQTPILKARKRPSIPVNEKTTQKDSSRKQNSQPQHMGSISQNVNGGHVYGGMQASQGNNNQQISHTYASKEQQSTLTDAVAEVQQLLEQLSQAFPIDTTLGKMAVATEAIKCIQNNQLLAQKIINALNSEGVFNFKKLLNHPAADFTIAALGDWYNNNSQNYLLTME
ncbi:CHAT domain-containing protein [Nostoc sp. DedQUE09]|uniref:CHAT domain-containing protein n=1 Tax=Nostoc sp. DedQUE09 TaxID=3075394 RepID=UPI002AD4ADC6|nr:CHAT domain-containing protein [Nostoc sp. DedQUE09]MDZ7950490.1 CHAT domain-containing protein [Nostoc sp. DedQUE09]